MTCKCIHTTIGRAASGKQSEHRAGQLGALGVNVGAKLSTMARVYSYCPWNTITSKGND